MLCSLFSLRFFAEEAYFYVDIVSFMEALKHNILFCGNLVRQRHREIAMCDSIRYERPMSPRPVGDSIGDLNRSGLVTAQVEAAITLGQQQEGEKRFEDTNIL